MIYEPREDSELLAEYVKKYAQGSVLDVGTGSGIQALAAANNKKVKSVTALDIQETVINYCKNNIKNNKIKFLVSDLFESVRNNKNFKNKKFDTIIFNPPYLPEDIQVKDLTIDGGKKGYEVIERFLNEVNTFLNANGIVLIVFSSLTKKQKIGEFIGKNLLESRLLDKKHIFFEELYVYLIKKSSILKQLESKKIKTIRYLAKGKRGIVFTGKYNNKKVAIKIKNPESEALLRISNEAKFLRILNRKNIGPKLLFSDEDFLVYGFVDGSLIVDYLKNNGKENIKKALKGIFEQLFAMDKLKISKEEMSHPQKHIIISKKNKPVLIDAKKSEISGISKIVPILIDFERSHYTLKPCNVTQFCNFLISKNISTLLGNCKIKISNKKIINAAKQYKKQQNKNNLGNILKLIK